jgi:hypothetical protein
MVLERFTHLHRIIEQGTAKQGNMQRPSVASVVQGGQTRAIIHVQ